ncbi:hypothetical protein PIB30_026127 [Stylosanthes scabra]|uniref:F-box domain-containing protein n=1 Tax=Stylosanthes scabra TaxID=79078 RepID=A0ABU6U9P6_9FABA|nr:hypothetical protein [Stylosanthes scabra]
MEYNVCEEVPLPPIPDDLLLDIFARSDANTVGRVRSVSPSRNQVLMSAQFISTYLKHAQFRSSSSFVHFWMKGPRAIGSWVMGFNIGSGLREVLKMPFLHNNQGRIEIVGSENGFIALRYVCDRHPPALIVWNPRGWNTSVVCPMYVQVLDPKRQFTPILIPAMARSNMTRLLHKSDGLYFAAVHRSENSYRWLIWKIEIVDGTYSWQLWAEHNGIGSPEYPECFVDDEIVTVQDTSQTRLHASAPTGTMISICRFHPQSQSRRLMQLEVGPFPFHVMSLTLCVQSLAPVEGFIGP